MSNEYTLHIPNKDIELFVKTVSRKIKRVISEIDVCEEKSVILALINEELENFKKDFAKDVSNLIKKENRIIIDESTINQIKKLIRALENEQ